MQHETRDMRTRTAFATCLLLLATLSTAWGASRSRNDEVKPSENAGRKGQYTVKTDFPGINYHVYVPQSYADDNPAGLHMFFNGQGGCKGNSNFGQWKTHFLEPFHMIGLNMQFLDGDNGKDTETKMRASHQAVLQLQADYNIIPGRGVISSFSGGGLPHGLYYTQHAKEIGKDWPFLHQGHYGSNFWRNIRGKEPLQSFFIGVGSKEWNMGKPTLGVSGCDRFIEAKRLYDHPEVYLQVAPHGHSVTNEEVKASAAMFHRMDLAYAPFLYEDNYDDRKVRTVVREGTKLNLGRMHKALERVLEKDTLEETTKKQAALLQTKLEKRVEAILLLMTQLAKDDPFLADWYYDEVYRSQFRGHPKEEALETIAKSIDRKVAKQGEKLFKEFTKKTPAIFRKHAYKLEEDAVKFFEEIKEDQPATSLLGSLAREFIAVQ